MNRLVNTRVYLSGPMDKCPDGGVTWRKAVTPQLKSLGVVVLDPTDKPTLVKENPQVRDNIAKCKVNKDWDGATTLIKEFVRLDLRMVSISDFLIVYVDTDIFMCGTIHEVVVATQDRKPILVVCKQGKLGCPNWLFGAVPHQTIFGNFDQAFEYLEFVNSSPLFDPLNDKRWRFFNLEVS